MNIADELRKLEELHQRGTLTDAEFAAAKASVLAGSREHRPFDDEIVQKQLEELKLQNAVSRLDREWELERERYMVAGRYGYRYVPNRAMSIVGGVLIVGFGVFWTAGASAIAGGFDGVFSLFPLFGILFIVTGIGMSIYSYSKASQYERAYQDYQQRRADLLAEPPEPR